MYRKKQSRALPMAVALIAIAACDGDNNLGDNIPPSAPAPGAAGDTTAIIGSNVVTFNNATPGTTATTMPIMGLAAGETVVGGDIRPANGTYYIVTNQSKVYTLNPSTGATTLVQTLSTPLDSAATTFGVDFNPVPDRLRVTTNTGQNLRINVDAAAGTTNTIVDGNLTVVTDAAGNVAPIDAVAYSNSFGAACRTGLFYIDTTNDRLLTAADPNVGVLRVLGNLGVNASGASGFEITFDTTSGQNVARAALNVGGAVNLYTIDMTTGAATIVPNGAFPAGTTAVTGLGIAPPATAPTQMPGDILAVVADNSLVSFMPGTPSKFCTAGLAVQGLNSGENIVDIDLRSSNSTLYAFTDANRLLTIDRTTGVATNITLSGAAIPALPMGATYSIDVNPQADALRLTGGTSNLAINFTTGAVTVQGNIALGMGVAAAANPLNIGGVAYVNAIAGSNNGAFTALYDIDVGNDTLYLQSAAAAGTLFLPVPLGLPMGTDLVSVAGFDINALSNVAVAAFNVTTSGTAATSSALYTINVTGSGATSATLVSAIGGGPGNIGGAATTVRGLAFQNNAQQALTASVVGLTTASPQQVVSFNVPSASVGSVTTTAPVDVSGLTDGEASVLSIDRRPADGLIYALGNLGNLYTLNPTSGALTKVSTLTMGLPLTAPVEIDFNPVVDRLRVIDSSTPQKNLRVNVVNGVTAVDTPLNLDTTLMGPMTPQIVAAAYSNNFFNVLPVPVMMGTPVPPRVGTTLYDIDIVNSLLFAQNPANDGKLTGIPVPGVTPAAPGPLVNGPFGATAGFDIIGGSNAFALAVLQPGSSMATSALYRVNVLPSLPSNTDPAGGAVAAGTATQLATTIVDPTSNPLTLSAATIFLAPSPTM